MGILDGKSTIITGGATGIGFAIARRFHNEGAKIVICDIKGDRLLEASSQISKNGERICTVKADVTVETDIKRVVEETVKEFGRIDILVNNAGIIRFGRLDQIHLSLWDTIMRTNAYATWRFMVAVLPEMRKSGGGSIINISSLSGIKAFPDLGLYCVSKAALQMLSQVMAMEVAVDNIRINIILPGLVEDTELLANELTQEELTDYFESRRSLHPLGRNAKPKDIADAALYLASEQSAFVTGVLLNVDGGRQLATNRPRGI